MTAIMASVVQNYRPQIRAALRYACGTDGRPTHTVDDVIEMVETDLAQCWPGPRSVIITEVIDRPRRRVLHFFLAGGVMRELEAMTPLILEWGVTQGCDSASLIGRKGWERSFLARTGWSRNDSILMEKML